MKLSILFAMSILIFASQAQANPNSSCGNMPVVGDETDFTLVQAAGSTTTTGALAIKTTAVDLDQDNVTQDYIVTDQNGAIVNLNTQNATIDDLQSLENGFDSPTSCTAAGGTWDSVSTPLKKYSACRVTHTIPNGQGTTWFAGVLNGIVMNVNVTTVNGVKSTQTLTIKGQSFGPPENCPPPPAPTPPTPTPYTCSSNIWCTPDQQCLNGICRPRNAFYQCDPFNTCSLGDSCVNGYCEGE